MSTWVARHEGSKVRTRLWRAGGYPMRSSRPWRTLRSFTANVRATGGVGLGGCCGHQQLQRPSWCVKLQAAYSQWADGWLLPRLRWAARATGPAQAWLAEVWLAQQGLRWGSTHTHTCARVGHGLIGLCASGRSHRAGLRSAQDGPDGRVGGGGGGGGGDGRPNGRCERRGHQRAPGHHKGVLQHADAAQEIALKGRIGTPLALQLRNARLMQRQRG